MARSALRITAVDVSADGTMRLLRGECFVAMLNPGEIRLESGISYSSPKVSGRSAAEARFAGMRENRLTFALQLDGTGAVPGSGTDGAPREVTERLAELKAVVSTYKGDRHEPRRVCIVWGRLLFYGRLTTMSTQFTLFRSNGTALRAKVDLAFVGFTTKQEAQRAANQQSPDLTHRVQVRRGDTLPLLCHRIYGDAQYYPEVARHNHLRDFRRLEPGTVLSFPPLG